ncbi:MAG: transaminase [Pseudomonadota bacterium]
MARSGFELNDDVLGSLREAERQAFAEKIPRSLALYGKSRKVMPNGVPCSWMAAFYPGTEIFAATGRGAHFEDVDGNRYLDMTQCDLSMACGFGPEPIARAVAERFANGSHFLLPTDDAIAVSQLLADRFGVPFWQFTLSASAANTEAIRISRFATGRDKVLIFDGKYHGHIDETLVEASAEGAKAEHHGLPKDVAERTLVVPFNDLEAVERALKSGEIACVLTEPVLTNIGVVQPDEGFHEALRGITKDHGSVLIIDETHTQVAAFGGFTRLWGLAPDILTIGKCVGGGVPVGAYGVSARLKDLIEANTEPQVTEEQTIALGGTTYGNALNMAAARAALEHVLTEPAYERVAGLGRQLADGIERIIEENGLPWRAHRLGNRSGICLSETLPRTAEESSATIGQTLNLATRAFMANRGIWEPIYIHGPSVSFAHEEADVATYLGALNDWVKRLVRAH